jgi:hypothetical protein
MIPRKVLELVASLIVLALCCAVVATQLLVRLTIGAAQ